MIERLKKYYGNAFTTNVELHKDGKYVWFLTSDDRKFGIHVNALSSDEQVLLETLFDKENERHLHRLSYQEQQWYDFLYDDGKHELIQDPRPFYRIISFKIKKEQQIEKGDLNEAIKGILPYDPIILWETSQEGIIIDGQNRSQFEDVDFEGFVDTIASDFYLDLFIFIGQVHPFSDQLKEEFHRQLSYFQRAKKLIQKKKVLSFQDLLPLTILDSIGAQKRHEIQQLVFQHVPIDDELLLTIKAYFHNNMNVSHTAKQLFMHRNSLQYRIDKFIEKTGMDIKQFNGAIITYLAILAFEYFSTD